MILLTGATGFLGEFVLRELVSKNYKVTCFVRKESNIDIIKSLNVDYIYGDLDNYDTLRNALKDKTALINIASLGFGHAPLIVKACKEMNVTRTIFISTTGVYTKLNPHSKSVRLAAESLIKESGLDYTIIRPTMIYGTPRDRNMWRLIKYLKKVCLIPVLGSGNYLQQPVYVKDLATAVISTYENPVCIKKTYNISGFEALTYNQIIDITAKELGKRAYKLHLPMKPCYYLLKIYEKISKSPKLKAEQVLRLNEDKAFRYEEAKTDFGYSPLDFQKGIQLEIKFISNKNEGYI